MLESKSINEVRPVVKDDAIPFKLLLIGTSGVGKSSILLRYTEDTYSPSFITTIGIDFKSKMIDVGNDRLKLQIWDTAGQERFRTITTAYYRSAMGIIIVYDVTSEKSFEKLPEWVRTVKDHGEENVLVMLVGNKSEVKTGRVISTERGQSYADELKIPFLEVSAKENTNISEAFMQLSKRMLKEHKQQANIKQQSGIPEKPADKSLIDLDPKQFPPSKETCC